ncbi:MAG: glucose-1-phosphate thymidylyltransferase, partial [Bacteroidales bacterium]|nr:glucose-1-phosphate thymidylyltransferase [Bacteroidales bacterium]
MRRGFFILLKQKMYLILFDDHSWDNLLPLTFTRPVSGLRVGILTIEEKWEKILGTPVSHITRDHLKNKFPCSTGEDNLIVNGSLLPDGNVVKALMALDQGQGLRKGKTLLGVRIDQASTEQFSTDQWIEKAMDYTDEVSLVDFPWKVFSLNGQEIQADFELVTRDRNGVQLSETVRVLHPDMIFAEPGFKGEFITLNATDGPIYLGADSEIMEGSTIRGPFALCEESVVKMAAKLYGPTTIGPYSKVGGEINNSVLQANSNKTHDGFLGNAVIGEWCNLGADTNNSNLKNIYGEVKIWNYPEKQFIGTGRQFCGLIMGDHSKCGINTMFNT